MHSIRAAVLVRARVRAFVVPPCFTMRAGEVSRYREKVAHMLSFLICSLIFIYVRAYVGCGNENIIIIVWCKLEEFLCYFHD